MPPLPTQFLVAPHTPRDSAHSRDGVVADHIAPLRNFRWLRLQGAEVQGRAGRRVCFRRLWNEVSECNGDAFSVYFVSSTTKTTLKKNLRCLGSRKYNALSFVTRFVIIILFRRAKPEVQSNFTTSQLCFVATLVFQQSLMCDRAVIRAYGNDLPNPMCIDLLDLGVSVFAESERTCSPHALCPATCTTS